MIGILFFFADHNKTRIKIV